MAGPEHLFPVADTAALVMLWASGYYETMPLIRTYLEKLDLSREIGRAHV